MVRESLPTVRDDVDTIEIRLALPSERNTWHDAGALHGVPLAVIPDDPILREMATTRGIPPDLIDARLRLHGTTLGEVQEQVANA